MRFAIGILILAGSGQVFLSGLPAQDTKVQDPQKQLGKTVGAPSYTYDSARDASADIERAVIEARKTGKRILLDVGGDWCPWCRALDRLLELHPDLVRLRDENFITVRVYYGSENKNPQILSRYSKVLGIPHVFVLNETGTLLHSQHMTELQVNGNYTAERMKDFLTKWSPPAGKATNRP